MDVKGYFVHAGYMGWTGNNYALFATEQDYLDWISEAA